MNESSSYTENDDNSNNSSSNNSNDSIDSNNSKKSVKVCSECSEPYESLPWCHNCDPQKYSESDYESGNAEVTQLIEETQEKLREKDSCFFQWIPFKKFKNCV